MSYKWSGGLKKEQRKKVIYASVAVVLGILLVCVQELQKERDYIQELERPAYAEDAADYNLEVYQEGSDEPLKLHVAVEARMYSREEAEQNLQEAADALPDILRGDNTNLQQVSSALRLPDSLPEYDVQISWNPQDLSLIEGSGEVHNESFGEEQKQETELMAFLQCGEYERSIRWPVTVIARHYTGEDRLYADIRNAVMQAQQDKTAGTVGLPSQVDGKKLSYTVREEHTPIGIFLVLGAIAIPAVFWGEKQKEQKKQKQRQEQLRVDYAGLISKLVLLTGAGMPIRLAWGKMVRDYERKQSDNGLRQPAYEEMRVAQRMMQSGIPDTAAYIQFGERCGIREYRKLASLLEQSVRSGAAELSRLLQAEMEEAFRERKNMARKKGEEAETRLLFPMMLMLAVVMAIVMVPALLSFQI